MANKRIQYNMTVEDFQKAQIVVAMMARGSTLDKRVFGNDEVYVMWSPIKCAQVPVNGKMAKLECVAQASSLELDQEKILNGEDALADYLNNVVSAHALFPSDLQSEYLDVYKKLEEKISSKKYFSENPNMQAYIKDTMAEIEKRLRVELDKAVADERQG